MNLVGRGEPPEKKEGVLLVIAYCSPPPQVWSVTQGPGKVDSGSTTAPFWHVPEGRGKGKSSNGHNFKKCTWWFTLLGRKK